MVNLCVIERRSSGSLRRTGRYTIFSTGAAGAGAPLAAFAPLDVPELRGWRIELVGGVDLPAIPCDPIPKPPLLDE